MDGENVAIHYRYAEGRRERLPALAAELVRLKVDVIVTSAPPVPQAAAQATSAIPIVFTSAVDPVAVGLVASLARPGGDITGLAAMGAEVVGKHLELLKELAPQVSHVAILRNPSNQFHARALREAESAARVLGMELQVLQARTPAEIEAAFSAMRRQRAGGALVFRDSFFFLQRMQIVGLAAKSRLPTVHGSREEAEAGGLMAYGESILQAWRRAATYVDKILKGAKAADLPVEQPTQFELVINLRTAKTLGLTIPQSVLLSADEILQ